MTAEMTHRERVLTAFSHEEPDRVPIDFGSTRTTTAVIPEYRLLKDHLGLEADDVLMDKRYQFAMIDESVIEALDVDLRGVFLGDWDESAAMELSSTRLRCAWGLEWVKPPSSFYYDLAGSPLTGDITVHDIATYPWPNPHDAGLTRGLRDRALALRETDYAIALSGIPPFVHYSQFLRGFEDWFMDTAADPELSGALMDAVIDVTLPVISDALDQVGDLVDVVWFGDDLGHQNSPLVAPESFRRLIKPRLARFVDAVKSRSEAKVLLHTDGSIYSILGDLIDIGIDAINPVQTTAKDMEDTARLKREFGDHLIWWGAIDTQDVLPFGTPDDVRREVEVRIRDLAPGGGYVLAAGHNVQPGVPIKNLMTMFEHAKRVGRYPIDPALGHT